MGNRIHNLGVASTMLYWPSRTGPENDVVKMTYIFITCVTFRFMQFVSLWLAYYSRNHLSHFLQISFYILRRERVACSLESPVCDFHFDCLLFCVSQVITNLVKMVKARDIRRPFCPAGHWLSEEVNIRADKVTVLSAVRLLPLMRLSGKSFIWFTQ